MAAVKDAVIAMTPEQEREAFSSEFPGVAPTVDAQGRIPAVSEVKKGMSESALKYLTRVVGMDQRMKLQGIPPATILNMNPYPLRVNSTLMGDMVIDPCPPGKPYNIHVIRGYLVSREEGIEGDGHPIPWVPIVLAREFADTYYSNGGVVVYVGDGKKDSPEEFAKKEPALARNIEEARAKMQAWMLDRVRKADSEWKTGGVAIRNINNIDRACAAMLHDKGLIAEMPQWMEKTPGKHGLGVACPQCRSFPNSEALICPNCGFVLDPRKAFDTGLIEIDNAALTRLERPVLVEMGISELIDQTVTERNADLRKKAAALRKEGKKQGS